MNREDARKYFKDCGLAYKDITMNHIYKLISLLNKNIAELDRHMIMMNEPKLSGKNKNIIFKDEKLVFAELRVKGTYFDDREAITFNDNGFIGFCGWADGINCDAIINGFIEWCNYLKNIVELTKE